MGNARVCCRSFRAKAGSARPTRVSLRCTWWAVSRRSYGPDIVGGHRVPAGTLVIVSPWLVHRRAETWTDPLAFRPERFLDAGGALPGYLPFGQGPRTVRNHVEDVRREAVGHLRLEHDRFGNTIVSERSILAF